MRLRHFALGAVLLTAAMLPLPVAAEGWEDAPESRVRLVPAGRVSAEQLAGRTHLPSPALLAGVEILLDPGWKTYWRSPGDGIPPQFDWRGSGNVAATQVLWPVPEHFRDAAGAYNGYRDRVVFPVIVAPRSPDEPVSLELRLAYAVCKDVCIPVSKRLSVELDGTAHGARDKVLDALDKTPIHADEQGRCAGLAFDELSAELDGSGPHLRVEIRHRPGAGPEELFAEPSSGLFMVHPEQRTSRSGRTVFHLDLTGLGNAEALSSETITLTAASRAQSCEMAWTMK